MDKREREKERERGGEGAGEGKGEERGRRERTILCDDVSCERDVTHVCL